MIRFYRHTQIDQNKWNHCIANATFTTLCAEFEFLDIASPNWCALIKGDYEYVMPLPVRSKLSIKYLYNPFFSIRLGIFSSHEISATIVKDFFEAIPKVFKQIDLLFNHLNPTQFISDSTIELVSYQLPLNRPYQLIAPLFSKNTQRNIKTAQNHQLTLSTCTINEIISLFRKNRGKTKNIHYKNKDYRILEQLATYALDIQKLDIVGAKDQNGKLLAGALFLRDRDRIWFWFSGRDNQYAEGRAMFFIVDEYIKMHDKQALVLDFNGSMNENVARFYKGFGAEKYSYPMVCYTRRFYLSKLIQLYKNIIK